jgi:hypothetical protein
LGTFNQVRRIAPGLLGLPALANELLNCRHATSTLFITHRRLTTSARSSCDPAIRSIVFGGWMPPSRTPRPAGRCLSTGPKAGSRGKDALCPRLEHEGSGGDNNDSPPLPIARTTAPRLVCSFASSACPSEIRRRNAEMRSPIPKPPHLSDLLVGVNVGRACSVGRSGGRQAFARKEGF